MLNCPYENFNHDGCDLNCCNVCCCKGEKGDRGPQGPKGDKGEPGEKGDPGAPGGALEYAYLMSQQQQTLQGPDTNIVFFERSLHISSGITYENGQIFLNVPGVYKITYEVYPSSGAGPDTIFRLEIGTSGLYALGSTAWYKLEESLVTNTFLVRISNPLSFRLRSSSIESITVPASSSSRARITINQIAHPTTGAEYAEITAE